MYPASVATKRAGTRTKLQDLERALGVRFKNHALLRQAVTHSSFLNEHPDEQLADYERLEFLGDAFLGWVVADELLKRYPSFMEGDLTRARASLVRGTTLAEIARELGAGKHLILGAGEEATGGRERGSSLAAVLEALVGAVLLDRGEKEARRLVLDWLGNAMGSLGPGGAPRDAKSSLQEACQRLGLPLPVYETIAEEGSSHAKRFTVRVMVDGEPRGDGEGNRKADAEQAAAADALTGFENES